MISIEKINIKLINILLFLLIIYFFYNTFDIWIYIINTIKKVLLPFLIAFIISYILNYIYIKFKKKIPKIIIILLFIICFIIIGICIYPVLINLIENIKDLIKESNIQKTLSKYIDINKYIYTNSFNIISNFVEIITNTIIIIIISISMFYNYENIKNKLKNIKMITNINTDLTNYLNTTVIIMLLEFIEYTVLFLIIGHPNGLLLSFLAAITTVIPYFGAIITNVLALLSASLISKQLFIYCSIIILIIPVFNSYVIEPKLYKNIFKINPIIILIILVVSSKLFGIIGTIFAIPIYIVIKNLTYLK